MDIKLGYGANGLPDGVLMECLWSILDHNGILMEFYGPYMDRYGVAILHVRGWVEI